MVKDTAFPDSTEEGVTDRLEFLPLLLRWLIRRLEIFLLVLFLAV